MCMQSSVKLSTDDEPACELKGGDAHTRKQKDHHQQQLLDVLQWV